MFAYWKLQLKRRARDVIRAFLWRLGFHVYRISPQERATLEEFRRRASEPALDNIFGAHLHRLRDLKTRYARVELPIAVHSVWGQKGKSEAMPDIGLAGLDLRAFRDRSSFVFDYRHADPNRTRMRYFIFADAARRKDSANLLGRLHEDDAFGCMGFEFPGIGFVTRDLLDSVIEINFLQRNLNILERDDLRVLDIGAGYGRLAHRMLEAAPRIKSYTCVDAVPESTFLCEFYLQYRGLQDRVEVLPADELERHFDNGRYDLALNIHSFSECTYAAIEWWLRSLQKMDVRYLMIVPNSPVAFLSFEQNGDRLDYAPLLRNLGYELIAREPIFEDPAVQQLMEVRDNMYLFERKGVAR